MPTRKKQEHRVKQRQADAAERQSAYDGLTTQQKIDRCATTPGESKKELARLQR